MARETETTTKTHRTTPSSAGSSLSSLSSLPPASRLPGFYKLAVDDRRRLLAERGLTPDDLRAFDSDGGLQLGTADRMIENVVGVLGLPLGVALNFVVDGEPVLVPMAVEEPSIVAACSHVARLAADALTGPDGGRGFVTEVDPPITVGQVQLLGVPDLDRATAALAQERAALLAAADALCPGLVERGGGCVDVRARVLPRLPADDVHGDLDSFGFDSGPMFVVHVALNTCDAMGANAVNTVVEGLSARLEALTGGRACLRILTNLADERRARARMRIPYRSLGPADAHDDVEGARVARAIVEAWRFAARDPWRACTHNKGILNGVDAVAVATGNDWRAIEAGAHAFAARSGRYTSLTRFFIDDEHRQLVGTIDLPMAVGTVGGATRVHPTVQAARKLLGPFATSASKLAGLLAAIGLAQNTGALKAMVTEGIQRGHMSLHARQVALAAGARVAPDQRGRVEVDLVAAALVQARDVRAARAAEVLAALRADDAIATTTAITERA
ncbi:MAG: hydroxymethylglutaryl-CoA reductase, degradative [Deltaproteobacteria bacterium]|nr:hydroxymethylglutaryl-CoA reductase, degradative [Deltaproteobacteria bacterium]